MTSATWSKFKYRGFQYTFNMPSVVVGIPDEIDELIDELVEGTGGPEDRNEAARKLMEWAANNKYGVEIE